MNRAALIEDIRVLEELQRRREFNQLSAFNPYPWQKEFYAAGLHNPQRMLMAANRVGKTHSAARELAYHLTGLYPDWWEGLVFEHAPRCWALGVSGEQIRDVLQTELLGDVLEGNNWGKGAIPRSLINTEDIVRSPQTRGLVKDVRIMHATGSYSSLSFKAYSQGQHVLMGSSIDFILIDEEPEDATIYPQCVVRTATGNRKKGGSVVLAFTPENGYTTLVGQFLDDLQPGQYMLNVTWEDAPHLSEAVKEQLLAAIPEYQREMRSKGIPILGSGIIFQVTDEQIMVPPFACPDHWLVINGMDFGWDHPQAHIQCWIDPDTQKFYVATEWKKSERDAVQAWTATKQWANAVPVAWPADGLQHEKGGGQQVRQQYKEAGFDMMEAHATHPEGGVSVEAGLWEMLQAMRDDQFKVFATCPEWLKEKRMYHRDDKGKIVKLHDDLISATRYAWMMRRNAIQMGTIKQLRHGGAFEGGGVVHDFDPYAS